MNELLALRERLRVLQSGHTDRLEERQILDLLKDASSDTLNALLTQLTASELRDLQSDLDDRRIGPDHRTEFFTLLTHERLSELGITARARLIQSFQLGHTSGAEELAIRNVFLATKGVALTELKNSIDLAADHRDLQQLVFRDIDDPAITAELLAHFKAEAVPAHKVKVLSDIDDTFYANLFDRRYPKKTVYPGVRALYAELDRGPDPTADRKGDLMFLSARPWDRAGFSEGITRSMLAEKNVGLCTVLSGDFLHLIGNDRIAAKKLVNFKQVISLYPE